MSDRYQIAADLDADIQSAEGTAARLREWMISKKIIVAEPTTDCTYGDRAGYPPGENYSLAASDKKPSATMFTQRPNGVDFITEHSVFYAAGVGRITMLCSACGESCELNDAWSAAVDEWYASKGPGVLKCEFCGAAAPVTNWRHDPPFAFGNVGVQFWNWPRLSDEFLIELGQVVGHRFRLVFGKI